MSGRMCGTSGRVAGSVSGRGRLMAEGAGVRKASRAEAWVAAYARGDVEAALAIEQVGPPLRPSAVMAAVMGLLAEGGLVLSAVSLKPAATVEKG